MTIKITMLLFVTIVLIDGGLSVNSKDDSACGFHDILKRFSEEKVKLALTARDVDDLTKEVKNMKKQIAKVKKLYQDIKNPVAFFAKNTKHKWVNGGHKLTYDTIVTDTYNAFDKATGTFICPKPGVYIFHYNVLSIGKTAHLILYKNGSEVVRAYADDVANHESSSNTALLQLRKGDRIYVRIPANFPANFYEQYNTFSGHIIS